MAEEAASHPGESRKSFASDCSWSITTAVRMIAVIFSLMKKASKGGGWERNE